MTGINRAIQTRQRAAGLDRLAARLTRGLLEKQQVSGDFPALQQLPPHDHALDLVGALVDRVIVDCSLGISLEQIGTLLDGDSDPTVRRVLRWRD